MLTRERVNKKIIIMIPISKRKVKAWLLWELTLLAIGVLVYILQ